MKAVSNLKMMNLFNEMLTLKKPQGESVLAQNLQTSGDSIDIATKDRDENLETRLSERNNLFLKKVEAAKLKIEQGTYGICEDCECAISEKRLLARPTANFCIGCQEAKESVERHNINHRRDLNNHFNNEEALEESLAMRNSIEAMKNFNFSQVVDL